MTKKQKKQLKIGAGVSVLLFFLLILIVPELKVDPVALGAEATFWQNAHAFFTSARTWLSSNLGLVALIAGGGIAGYYFLIRK